MEGRTLGTQWHAAGPENPAERLLHELFEEQAEVQPEATAVVYEGQRLTYGQLELDANRLANVLRSKGLRADSRVAICMERSLDLVVAVLGALKAGAAYVPLDPEYPQARLAYMLADSDAEVLLTHEALLSKLPPSDVRMICADRDRGQLQTAPHSRPPRLALPDNLAYVIYTSGSTGKPKGVMVPHRGVVNRLQWMQETYRLSPDDRVLHKTSISFDVSVWELLWPLMFGAHLVLAAPNGHRDAVYLSELIEREGVTHLHFVPTMLAVMIELFTRPGCRSVKHVVCSGEALPAQLAKLFKLRVSARLSNLYGPTEASIDVTSQECDSVGSGPTIPIGLPITNITTHILRPDLSEASDEEAGVLYIGGVGLARCYAKQPARTAERFIPDPFAATPGARLYCTGDLVRRTRDGPLEFLGRVDDQVKIRGFRVELAEIEAVLREHSGIKDVAAIVHGSNSGAHIVAYVVPDFGSRVVVPALLSQARRLLPEYMVPQAIVELDHLPTTTSGKVDRQSLSESDRSRPVFSMVPNLTPTEELLVDIWAELLGHGSLGLRDDFFALGGNSLLANSLALGIMRATGVRIPLPDVFAHPTIDTLAKHLERLGVGPRHHPPWPGDRVVWSKSAASSLSRQQEQVWFIHRLSPNNLAYNFQSILLMRGRLDLEALHVAVESVLQRHEIFRTTFHEDRGTPFQVVHKKAVVDLQLVDLACRSEERERRYEDLVEAEVGRVFDPGRLPLIKWRVFRLSSLEHRLLHIEHHLVHDGWSFNLFLEEVLAEYRARVLGTPTPDHASVPYGAFVEAQRRWLDGDEATRQRAYWRRRLAGANGILSLPYDHARPEDPCFDGAAHRFEIESSLSQRLREYSRSRRVTLFSTMLAAFFALLNRYTREHDLCVGSGFANRRDARWQQLMGMVVNTVALRAEVDDQINFDELVMRTHALVLEAYENQELPISEVLRDLSVKRAASRNPLFQTAFSFHDSPRPPLTLPGLNLELHEAFRNLSAKFDINVIVIPRMEQRLRTTLDDGPDDITMIWEYSTAVFDQDTVLRLARNYLLLVEAGINAAQAPLSRLPLTERSERALVRSLNPH